MEQPIALIFTTSFLRSLSLKWFPNWGTYTPEGMRGDRGGITAVSNKNEH